MTPVSLWQGREAAALRDAHRMTIEAFAEMLGIAARTVAEWNRKPQMRPSVQMQQILDSTLERATDDVKARFAGLLSASDAPSKEEGGISSATAQPMRVVISIVVAGGQVLMVRNRSGAIGWQFPAGIVKPGREDDIENVAVAETFAETGVHCVVRRSLGSRIHPVTGVLCEYLLCDYVSGDATNGDPLENAAVTWLDRKGALAVIPNGQLFPPVEEILREPVGNESGGTGPAIAAAVIVERNKVLLVRRQVAEGSLSWQFPAGKVEPGETPEQAAERETREEVGFNVRARQILGQRTHPVTGRKMVYVACDADGGTPTLVDTDELDAMDWCPIDEVEARLTAGVFQPVLEYLRAGATR